MLVCPDGVGMFRFCPVCIVGKLSTPSHDVPDMAVFVGIVTCTEGELLLEYLVTVRGFEIWTVFVLPLVVDIVE